MNTSLSTERRWLLDVLRVMARELEDARPGETQVAPVVRHLAGLVGAPPAQVADDWEAVAQAVFSVCWGNLDHAA